MQSNRTRDSQPIRETAANEKKRSSKLFSFFKLFQNNKLSDRNNRLFPDDRSSSQSSDSIRSTKTMVSSGTIASFVFLNPATYRCFRKKPQTNQQLTNDRPVTISSANWHTRETVPAGKRKLRKSLSESQLNKLASRPTVLAARASSMPRLRFENVKVSRKKIKRKAPQPPQFPVAVADREPDSVPDSKPWYKRSVTVTTTIKRNGNRILPKINFHATKNDLLQTKPNRKSGITFLTNISSLDHEAGEILRKDAVESQRPQILKVKYLQQSLTKKRRIEQEPLIRTSAAACVTRTKNLLFPAKVITNEKAINSPIIENEKNSLKAKANNKWKCTKCLKENDYWRILCYFCNHIKPFSEKPRAGDRERKSLKKKHVTKNRNVLMAESKNSSTFENACTLRIEDAGRGKNGRSDSSYETIEPDQDRLKKMLIEMKNSLPKRTKTNAGIVSAYENLEPVAKNIQKDKICSKSAKLERVTATDSLPKPVKLISWQRFEEMERERLELLQIYSDLRDDTANLNLSTLQKLCNNVPKHLLVGTVEINKLLRNLEIAIAGGKMDRAAKIAKELAVLQIRCSVTRHNSGHVYHEVQYVNS